jgi:hypothetical protein
MYKERKGKKGREKLDFLQLEKNDRTRTIVVLHFYGTLEQFSHKINILHLIFFGIKVSS